MSFPERHETLESRIAFVHYGYCYGELTLHMTCLRIADYTSALDLGLHLGEALLIDESLFIGRSSEV